MSVLTRMFGFARIDLVEDMVGSAILEAMKSWKQSGIPNNPSVGIHRVARNRILDAIRREKTFEKALALSGQSGRSNEVLMEQWLSEELSDSLLRMMFVCCHPCNDRNPKSPSR